MKLRRDQIFLLSDLITACMSDILSRGHENKLHQDGRVNLNSEQGKLNALHEIHEQVMSEPDYVDPLVHAVQTADGYVEVAAFSVVEQEKLSTQDSSRMVRKSKCVNRIRKEGDIA